MDVCTKPESEFASTMNRLDIAIQTLSVNVEKTVQRCKPMASQANPSPETDKAKPSLCEIIDKLDLFIDRISQESDKLDSLLARLRM